MNVYLQLPEELEPIRQALLRRGFAPGEPEQGLVFAARPPADWPEVEQALQECFRLTRRAAAAGARMVYLVRHADLLGWHGAASAMLAGALVSGARALAMEGQKRQLTINVVAYEEGADAEAVASWVQFLLEAASGVSGSVIPVGTGHLGKVVP